MGTCKRAELWSVYISFLITRMYMTIGNWLAHTINSLFTNLNDVLGSLYTNHYHFNNAILNIQCYVMLI